MPHQTSYLEYPDSDLSRILGWAVTVLFAVSAIGIGFAVGLVLF